MYDVYQIYIGQWRGGICAPSTMPVILPNPSVRIQKDFQRITVHSSIKEPAQVTIAPAQETRPINHRINTKWKCNVNERETGVSSMDLDLDFNT